LCWWRNAGIYGGRHDRRAVIAMTDTIGRNDSYTCSRDYQLFGPGPKRVLALDGGGVRGAITVAFLERIEALLSQHYARRVRLGDYFHLIGGTSTDRLSPARWRSVIRRRR
jgi:hypothetical protein